MAERIRQASGGSIDAFIDTVGDGYVESAGQLGVRPERINTNVVRRHIDQGAGAGLIVDGDCAYTGLLRSAS
ncbi:hypothetical protein [Streptomyces sp. NPDC001250]|uniref:hypothetical protein n=1 Tax=Streptomyces sp. NPDC001250 TaxID=3154382 RepID=UPI00332E7691